MSFHISTPVHNPKDVIPALAEGERHWRKGYSAWELAHSWVCAGGIPGPVARVLGQAPEYVGATLVEGFFERRTALRSRGADSQTDLLALLRLADGHAVLGIEGKVNEPFGPLVGDWLAAGGDGRKVRLAVLCRALGLAESEVDHLRYQLLHRTCAAIFEAQGYQVPSAALLVHSFSSRHAWFEDFRSFTEALGASCEATGTISKPIRCEGIDLRLGWVADQARD